MRTGLLPLRFQLNPNPLQPSKPLSTQTANTGSSGPSVEISG